MASRVNSLLDSVSLGTVNTKNELNGQPYSISCLLMLKTKPNQPKNPTEFKTGSNSQI